MVFNSVFRLKGTVFKLDGTTGNGAERISGTFGCMSAALCAARLFSKHGVIRVGGGEAGNPAGFDSRRAVSAGPRGFAVNLRSGAVDVSLLLVHFPLFCQLMSLVSAAVIPALQSPSCSARAAGEIGSTQDRGL
jgi:hypothetical protein